MLVAKAPPFLFSKKKQSYLILEKCFHTVKNVRSELNTQAVSFCFCSLCGVSYGGAVTSYQIWVTSRVSMTVFTPFIHYRFTWCVEVWTCLYLFWKRLLQVLTSVGWASNSFRTFSPSVLSNSDFLHSPLPLPREGNGTPLQCSCLENPMDGKAWWAAVSEVAKSWT